MSKGSSRQLYDDDYGDGYGDDQYDDGQEQYDDDDETEDYVKAVRDKLTADESRRASRLEIVSQLEKYDYDVKKAVKGLKDYLKPVVAPKPQNKTNTAAKPTTSSASTVVATAAPSEKQPRAPAPLITKPSQLNIAETGEVALGRESSMASELTLAVVGHVDSGKSTLVGHLMNKLGLVTSRAVAKNERDAENIGKATFGLAWVTDERAAEREHGVTIDVAERRFATSPERSYLILDTPGHRDFLPNMIKGAAQADIAILVVPATEGEYESAMKDSAQTKEHCFLLKALGVHQVIVAVNKMDQTQPVPWNSDRFSYIQHDITRFLVEEIRFPPESVQCLPLSGLTGENLVSVSAECPLSAWYVSRPSLVAALDAVQLPMGRQLLQRPFRALASVVSSDRMTLELDVQVLQGVLQRGAEVGLALMLRSSSHSSSSTGTSSGSGGTQAPGANCRLFVGRALQVHRETVNSSSPESVSIAQARDRVRISLQLTASNYHHNLHAQGHLSASAASSVTQWLQDFEEDQECLLFRGVPCPTQARNFTATIVTMPTLREAILPGTSLELYLKGVEMQCRVTALLSEVGSGNSNSSSGSAGVSKSKPKILRDGGRTAVVQLQVAQEVVLDSFAVCRALGRFVLRSKGFTVAVGIVDEVHEER